MSTPIFSSSTTSSTASQEAAGVVEKDPCPHQRVIHPTGWLADSQGFSSATTLSSMSTGSSANGIHDGRLRQVDLGVGEVAVGLVTGQHVQQVAGQQRPHHLLRAAVRAGQSDDAGQPPALDQAPGLGLVDGAKRRGLPHPGQLNGVGAQRHRVAGGGEDQTGHRQRRRGLLGRRLGHRRKHRDDGLRLRRACPRRRTPPPTPPKPCPTTPSFVGCTLIFPGPSRTPAMMSRVVPRSNARLSTDGATPVSVSGAAATMPHDARCSSVPS